MLDAEVEPGCALELGSTDDERCAQVKAFGRMGTRQLDELMFGRVSIKTMCQRGGLPSRTPVFSPLP
jgi:hypothetical protein